MYYVMGTGSRSMVTAENASEIYKVLREKIFEIREAHPDLVLISGMAEGWDEAIAKIGLRDEIPYHAYLPNPTYGSYYWGQHSKLGVDRKETFDTLLNGAQEVIVSCDAIYTPEKEHSNFLRNREMIAASDLALVYDAGSSGTRHAVMHLKAAGVPMEIYPFNPVLFDDLNS